MVNADQRNNIKKQIRQNTEKIAELKRLKINIERDYEEVKSAINQENNVLEEIYYYSEGTNASRFAQRDIEEATELSGSVEKVFQEYKDLITKNIHEMNQKIDLQEQQLTLLEREHKNDEV